MQAYVMTVALQEYAEDDDHVDHNKTFLPNQSYTINNRGFY